MKNQMQQLHALWTARSPRERGILLALAWVAGLAIGWSVLLAPAIQTLRTAPAAHAKLDSDLVEMKRLQAKAKAAQGNARASAAEAMTSLETVATAHGARLDKAGNRVQITVSGMKPAQVGQLLANLRSSAQVAPMAATLKREPSGAWSGVLEIAAPAN